MGVFIDQIHPMDGHHEKHQGTVRHNGHVCEAILVGPYDRLLTLLQTETTAEYELNEIISAEMDLPKNDRVSGIFPGQNGQLIVDGTVHYEMVIDQNVSWFDIYIQNGADFLNVSSEDLGEKPKLDTRIRITGKGLHVYPTFK